MESLKVIKLSKTSLKKATKIYPADKVDCPDGSKYDTNEILRYPYARGYDEGQKDLMEKAVKWLKSCLDNGCWVANNLCDYDKKGIVQGFKEMMSE